MPFTAAGTRWREARALPSLSRGRELHDADAGSVTIELAVGLVSVCALLALLLPLGHLSLTRASLCEAVREGARTLTLGGSVAEAQARAARVHGSALTLTEERDGRWVKVRVEAPWGGGPVSTRATCEVEAPLEEWLP